MNLSDVFPSKYIKSDDLNGKTYTLTISRCVMENVGSNPPESRLIIYFEETEKGLVTNKTNSDMVAYITNSRETDDWPGTKVLLTTEPTSFQGKITKGLRIKVPPKNGASQPPAKAPDKITSGPALQRAVAAQKAQQIADEEQQHDQSDDDIPF